MNEVRCPNCNHRIGTWLNGTLITKCDECKKLIIIDRRGEKLDIVLEQITIKAL